SIPRPPTSTLFPYTTLFRSPLKNTLTFTMGLLAVLLGVWELHQNKMATRELLWQYRNQLSHFSRARAQLARVTTRRRCNDVLARSEEHTSELQSLAYLVCRL